MMFISPHIAATSDIYGNRYDQLKLSEMKRDINAPNDQVKPLQLQTPRFKTPTTQTPPTPTSQ